MSNLIIHNKDWNYCLFDMPYIRENQEEILKSCQQTLTNINKICQSKEENVTWFYHRYNVFSASAGDIHFYKMYTELVNCVRQFFILEKIKYDEQLWIQSWLNNHGIEDLLTRHDHQSPVSGYFSIDPKESQTRFYYRHSDEIAYSIQNKIGQLYIGPGKIDHEVLIDKRFEGRRITIAFDIDNTPSTNLGQIPLLI
jgi:hypothetical protein